MARQPKLIEDHEPEVLPVTETITYVPGEGDKASVTWCGHTFHANVPKDITGHAKGTDREKLNLHLIERARENKTFRVGTGVRKRDPSRDPETAEEYRQYFANWMQHPSLNSSDTHAEDLIARFAKDRALQATCGVGSDDFDYMATLFMPKLHEFAKRDELSDPELAQVWMRHGYNTLPW